MSKPNWADETIVGRIRVDGGWDRRYARSWRQAEPYRHDVRRTVIEVVAGVVVLNLWAIGLALWLVILSVPS